jgi:predicted AlkP superfamily phosphohydrolase/phosphomutase
MQRPKVAVIGIDGFSPKQMDFYLSQDALPNIGAVVRSGVYIPLISTLPACTPVAWASMATGAFPSVTGIEGFLLHRQGCQFDERISGCYAHRCQAEPIWSTAARNGKRSYVVKFPLSYPSNEGTFRLDGAAGWGGIKCLHESASSSVGANQYARPGSTKIAASLEPWRNEKAIKGEIQWRGVWRLPCLWNNNHVDVHIALLDSGQNLQVIVSPSSDAGQAWVSLCQGEWSPPLVISAPSRRGTVPCAFRVKVLECSTDPPVLRLFNTVLHELSGHSYPEDLWSRYREIAGPIEEQSEPSLVFHAGLDLETQLEIFRLNVDWLTRVSVGLLSREPWDLFMMQVHIIDWAHHLLHGKIDPAHPGYEEKMAEYYTGVMLQCYRMVDELVGAVAETIGSEANLIVMGDHGQDVQHSTFRTNEWLATHDLLAWKDDGQEVDWNHTRAYAAGNYIYLNLVGREPNGIVKSSEIPDLISTVLTKLRKLQDPSRGQPVILIADPKEAFAELGGDGAGVGDIVFCCHSGYQATNGRGNVLSGTRVFHEFTSGHDHYWPLDEKIQTRMFAAGPSFRRGFRCSSLARIIDVAPTICSVLGIPAPQQCQGNSMNMLFADQNIPVLL